MERGARPLRPKSPWPTEVQQARRIAFTIGMLAALQFVLNGLEIIVGRGIMVGIWIGSGAFVAAVTIRIATYFSRRRRMLA